MRKPIGIMTAVILLALTSCSGSFIDPGMMDMENGGMGGSGNGNGSENSTGGNGGGGNTWSKLTAGTGMWISNGTLLSFFIEDGKKRVKVDLWNSYPVSVSGNTISIGGGSSDTLTITFKTNTTMTLSNGKSEFARKLEGTYTRYQ
jgi:hypothetical protein